MEWVVELKMPSGVVWYLAEVRGMAALTAEHERALRFETEAKAKKFLGKLRADDAGSKKMLSAFRAVQKGLN